MSAPTTPVPVSVTIPPYGWRRLCFTCEGHLDLSWVLAVIYALLGVAGSVMEFVRPLDTRPRALWWAWLTGQFLTLMIAAVPVAKARLLAGLRKHDCAIVPAPADEVTS